ncbi:MAG: hypothetical protein AAGG02_04430 [Cyanobacteria bacterium P01_H01_bin.15]
MRTRLVHLSLPRQTALSGLVVEVKKKLQQEGTPLRWAITAINADIYEVEGVVTVHESIEDDSSVSKRDPSPVKP